MNFIMILIALSNPFWGNFARMIQEPKWLDLVASKILSSLSSAGIKKIETSLTLTFIIIFFSIGIAYIFLGAVSHHILADVFALFALVYSLRDFAFLTSPIPEEMLREFMHDLFSVIFWFLILGPAGALLYRLVRDWSVVENQEEIRWRVEILLEWLDWVPSRMITFGFALFGHFSAGIKMMTMHIFMPSRDNIRYLSRCFQAVLMQEEANENKVLIATEYLRKLLLRTSAMWLLVVFLISLN